MLEGLKGQMDGKRAPCEPQEAALVPRDRGTNGGGGGVTEEMQPLTAAA